MNLEKLEKVIELVRKHGMHEVRIEDDDTKITVRATPPGTGAPMMAAPQQPMYHQSPMAPAPVAAAPEAAPAAKAAPVGKVMKSPFVGTFYLAPSPEADAFTSVGARVKKGDTLCIVEAMKLMNEIESEFDGVIKEILVDNETPVEFEQPLFLFE
jgi:acetyl-CoA carboxylase biotin carboxyl carrier protein